MILEQLRGLRGFRALHVSKKKTSKRLLSFKGNNLTVTAACCSQGGCLSHISLLLRFNL